MLEDLPFDMIVHDSPLKEKRQGDQSIGEKWALYLTEITLHPNAGGFFNQFIGKAENVHYITLSWDFSGLSPTIYPYLNFQCNKLPLEIMAADSHQFSGNGLPIFAKKDVVESLNACLIFFKNRKDEHSIDEILEHAERLVNNSSLRQELSKMTFDPTDPDTDRLSKLAELLYMDIEEFLSGAKYIKHLSTINCVFDAEKPWTKYKEEIIEKDLVRITINKRSY